MAESLQQRQFDDLYSGAGTTVAGGSLPIAPWRLDEPQPAVLDMAAAGLDDPVLDCGCGDGENAMALAQRGHRVTAFDGSPAAIERCRATAAKRGVDVEFLVADATVLDGVGDGFRTVLDSALLHCLDQDSRHAYLAALHRVCVPGARLHLLCLDETTPAAMPVPGGLDAARLRAELEPAWQVTSVRRSHYTSGLSRRAWHDHVVPVVGDYPLGLDRPEGVDRHGRVLLPVHQILAVRR